MHIIFTRVSFSYTSLFTHKTPAERRAILPISQFNPQLPKLYHHPLKPLSLRDRLPARNGACTASSPNKIPLRPPLVSSATRPRRTSRSYRFPRGDRCAEEGEFQRIIARERRAAFANCRRRAPRTFRLRYALHRTEEPSR